MKIFHKNAHSAYRNFCIEQLIHTQKLLLIKTCPQKKKNYTGIFAQKNFYTEKFSRKEPLYTEKSYTKKLLRTNTFT